MAIEVLDSSGHLKETGPITQNYVFGWPDAHEEAEVPMVIPGPRGADGAVAGTGPATTVEVNLGSTMVWRGKFTITDASITSSLKVLAWQAPGPYTGKGTRADEAELQPVHVTAVESQTGSAVVYWETPPVVSYTSRGYDSRSPATDGTESPPVGVGLEQFTAQRLNRVRGNVKFVYMVCRNGGTGLFKTTSTGTLQNFDFGNADLVLLSGISATTVHSLRAGTSGQRVTFVCTAFTQAFRHNSSTLGGGIAFDNFLKTTDGDTYITTTGGTATFIYDSTIPSWRMIDHDQGQQIRQTFSAGDFTASGTQTWTVDSGDIIQDDYYVKGKQVTWIYYYTPTSVGGTPSFALRRAIPSIFTPLASGALADLSLGVQTDNGGTRGVLVASVATGDAFISFLKTDISNWANSTNNTTLAGRISWLCI